MDAKTVIASQYQAALKMLAQAVEQCLDVVWDDSSHRNRFWHIAYHALFYTDLYLRSSGEAFSAWEKHRENYEFLGPVPWPPHEKPEIGQAYSQDELEYLALCQDLVREMVPALDLGGASGFDWLPMNKLELQFYNIRHLQMHTGELCERLGTEANVDVDWVGMAPED
jgi:hypothetical protein